MTVDEAATALGITRNAVRKAIVRGQLPATRKPGKVYGPGNASSAYVYEIEAADVERYRVARAGGPT